MTKEDALRKEAIRKDIFKKREALTDQYRQEAENKIYEKIFSLPEFQEAETIMIYYSTEDEFNTMPIIERAWKDGKQVGSPRVFPKRVIEAMELTPATEFEESKFGIKEPVKETPIIAPEDIDLIIMPCVSSNRDGERVGYGGGYYDRFLERAENALLVLPYYSKLETQDIPMEEHDKKIDIVIFEDGIYDTRTVEKE